MNEKDTVTQYREQMVKEHRKERAREYQELKRNRENRGMCAMPGGPQQPFALRPGE